MNIATKTLSIRRLAVLREATGWCGAGTFEPRTSWPLQPLVAFLEQSVRAFTLAVDLATRGVGLLLQPDHV